MAEYSGFWDTNGTGDGTSGGFTEEKLRALFQMLGLSTATTQGVMKTYLNALAVTGTSSPVSVNTGGAIVYGFWYVNDTSTTVAVPTPASATRIDRIVLRASWASQTVRLVRVAGTEGGGAPSLTQTANTTWDIPLAQVSITTGGVITVTDQRVYATGNFEAATANIADDAITNGKLRDSAALSVIGRSANSTGDPADIAAGTDGHVLRRSGTALEFGTVATAGIADNAIDDTKVGDRVPQFYRRQGGNTSNWKTPGTTTYTPGSVRTQGGSVEQAGIASNGNFSVTFPVAFSNIPIVYLNFINAGSGGFISLFVGTYASDISTSGFTIYWRTSDGSAISSPVFNWLAIGPE